MRHPGLRLNRRARQKVCTSGGACTTTKGSLTTEERQLHASIRSGLRRTGKVVGLCGQKNVQLLLLESRVFAAWRCLGNNSVLVPAQALRRSAKDPCQERRSGWWWAAACGEWQHAMNQRSLVPPDGCCSALPYHAPQTATTQRAPCTPGCKLAKPHLYGGPTAGDAPKPHRKSVGALPASRHGAEQHPPERRHAGCKACLHVIPQLLWAAEVQGVQERGALEARPHGCRRGAVCVCA